MLGFLKLCETEIRLDDGSINNHIKAGLQLTSMLGFLTNNNQNDEDLLPPPVRRLIFGEKTEEEDLKQLAGDFYDQLENLEEAHDERIMSCEIKVEGKQVKVELKKDRGSPSRGYGKSSDRRMKEESVTFTLDELLEQDREYIIDRIEEQPDESVAAPGHSATASVSKGSPSEDELIELDESNSDSGGDVSDSGHQSSVSNHGMDAGDDVKENVKDHLS